ncbi:MBL fold metallo-hydrolase [Rhodothermus sp. AH-315-K08]|nr:MBL fold metallo-hydrolase [Rhodothermus sp. AH-315-K08]
MDRLLFLAVIALLVRPVFAQPDLSSVEIQTIPLADNVYMLVGSGGNIGLSVGDDGAFLIDDQYAPLTEKIKAAVGALTDAPVRFLVNTHWHGDHTGGNEAWGEGGATIVAHENVRERMSTEQFLAAFNARTPPSPEAALPVVTFTDAVSFHWNGDEIRVFHVSTAHTDGDAVVHFVGADVIHTGDTFFNKMYPFIDTSTGGTMAGMIAAADAVLEIAGPDTKIIPGHGPLADRADLEAYRAVLATAHERISALVAEGKSREEVVASDPMHDFNETWGAGFLGPEMWVGIAYDAVVAH